jgi:hypothetical protein
MVSVNTLSMSASGVWQYVSKSVEDKHGPPLNNDGKTRAHLLIAAWRLEIIPKGGGVSVSYIVHVDPKGNIPSCNFINLNL